MIKTKGMECLAAEENKSLMRMLADTMSQVAEQTWTDNDKWMGILETMHSFITSNDPRLIEVALVLFSKLTDWMNSDPVFQNMSRQMYDVLLKFLQDAPNDDIRIAACKASTNFIMVRPALQAAYSAVCAVSALPGRSATAVCAAPLPALRAAPLPSVRRVRAERAAACRALRTPIR